MAIRRILVCLVLCAAWLPSLVLGADVNDFTETVGALEAKPIPADAPGLVYWDQAAADALGIKNPAGRPGSQALNDWAEAHLGWEVQSAENSGQHSKHYFIERDSAGGSGRAGYIEVSDGVWVNTKGIGITGYGRTSGTPRGPPSDTFVSHADGSATLAEAIKEAIYARIGDNETSRGASRVIGIIATGRMLHYRDGGQAPEALIIRAPMKRADQAAHADEIVDSLAELNAKRFLKGDFVNSSNIGTHGQLVDFGCLTHTCDYINSSSSQKARFLEEYKKVPYWGSRISFLPEVHELGPKRFDPSFGRYLVNQMGIPEAHLSRVPDRLYGRLAEVFAELVGDDPNVVLDNEAIDPEHLQSRAKLNQVMKGFAGEFFGAKDPKFAAFDASMHKMQGEISSERTLQLSDELFARVFEVLSEIRKQHPETKRPGYAEAVRRVAEFKLRDASEILRPEIFRRSNEAASAFMNSRDPAVIQNLIDDIVARNHITTGAVADSLFAFAADDKETKIHVRAAKDTSGKVTIFSHPEHAGANLSAGDQPYFRISTDAWKTYRDYPATVDHSRGYPEFIVRIPHDDKLPVTAELTKVAPFWKTAAGDAKWPTTEKFDLAAPPLFLNERLGLEGDLSRVPDRMLEDYGIAVRPTPPGARPKKRRHLDGCARLFEAVSFWPSAKP